MRIPVVTLKFWNEMGSAPATADEIAEIVTLAGESLPTDYTDFLSRHGFVAWDIDIPDTFRYLLGPVEERVIRTASVSQMSSLDYFRDFARFGRSNEPSRGLPQFPNTHFPIVGTPGQDKVLLEMSPTSGRIWFWPEREDPWGTGDNTELGFVADSFTAFIEGLRLEGDL